MRKFLTLLLFLVICFNSYSQDVIHRKNGERIDCEIQRENDSIVYFKQIRNSYPVETFIRRNDIRAIEYGVGSGEEQSQTDKSNNSSNRTIKELNTISAGFGIGLEYGGIGVNLLLSPSQYFGIFGGLGYAYGDIRYNGGARINIFPKSRTNLFLMGMYGYNAVVIVNNGPGLSKTFYGTTLGVGLEFRGTKRSGMWSIAVLFPIREEAYDYIKYLEDEKDVEFENDLFPVGISIGYRF